MENAHDKPRLPRLCCTPEGCRLLKEQGASGSSSPFQPLSRAVGVLGERSLDMVLKKRDSIACNVATAFCDATVALVSPESISARRKVKGMDKGRTILTIASWRN